jgi:hypothetical protein
MTMRKRMAIALRIVYQIVSLLTDGSGRVSSAHQRVYKVSGVWQSAILSFIGV